MITFSELREQSLAFYEKLKEIRIKDEHDQYVHNGVIELQEMQQEHFPDFPVEINTNFIVSGPLFGLSYANWEYSLEASEEGLKFLEIPENRLKTIIWWSMIRAFARNNEAQSRYGVDSNTNVIYGRMSTSSMNAEDDESSAMFVLRMISELKVTKDMMQDATRYYQRLIHQLRNNVSRQRESSGIEKILESGPSGDRDWKREMEVQIVELQKQLPSNSLASRTWGFEIESPDCKGVEPLTGSGIEKGDDGSLRSYEANDDCECDCRECMYHECDCDNCDMYNDSPDHCGDNSCSTAESAEYRSTGGIQRSKHNGMYDLCKKLIDEDAEMNDTAGTHIHVYGQDLTTHQVGQVLAIYKRLENLFDVICGRSNTGYARPIVVDHVRNAIRKSNPVLEADKPRAVNVSQLLGGRGTIEFRQMDCNYNADRITLFAWLVRGLVTAAKRGATIAAFASVTNYYDLVVALGKFNYFLANETPELVVPGSKVDMNVLQTVSHNRA